MAGPFEGVQIIDITSVLMGPLATQLFADFGADVIKVEPPGGDVLRSVGPGRHPDMCALYLTLNRNKRSVVLDLKSDQGREALLKLVEKADVLFYNVRPQAMARLGLSYEKVRAANEQIIYCGAYGFAQDGPYAANPAYDDLIQGATGIPALTQRMTGTPNYAPFSIADHLCGMHAAFCLSSALFHRKNTGRGQAVEVPMFEAMAQTILTHHIYGKTFVPPIGEAGYPRQISPNRRPYPTLDGHVSVLLFTDAQWQRFFKSVDMAHVMDDSRFSDVNNRTQNTEALYKVLQDCLAQRTTAHWIKLFQEADIPAMPMQTVDQLLEDPHLKATGFFREVDHPSEGKIVSMNVASGWTDSVPDEHRAPAPRLGEHTQQVLREAGYSAQQIEALAARGNVREASKQIQTDKP
jgi:crotonobetainyl-CoA:carnitine CoA-transferase CaiB-like acyl-CoA transferase